MRLGIAHKVSLLSSVLVALTSGLVAAVFFYFLEELSTERRYGYMTDVAAQVATSLRSEISGISKDAVLISELPVTQAIFAAKTPEERARQSEALAGTLERWVSVTPHMFQLRVLSYDGQELVRIDRRAGTVRRIAAEELQNKGGREYFQKALALAEGQVYVSPIDLNQEHGQIEVPHVPTLRVSTPVKDTAGKSLAVVVINLSMKDVFASLEQVTVGLGQLLIANEHGDYLLHPTEAKTFGFDLGQRHRLGDDFPSMTTLFDSPFDEPRNVRDDSSGHVWLTRVQPVNLGGTPVPRRLVVAVQADRKVLTAYFEPLRNRLLVVATILIAFATLASVLLSRRIARPLQSLSRDMKSFDPNLEAPPTPLPASDTREISDLAIAFGAMRDVVREKTHKLAVTNSELEQFTYAAAHDLQEPLRKITSFSQLLREDLGPVPPEGDVALYLGALQRSAQNMRTLIDDILQLPQAGRMPQVEAIDSGESLKTALDVLDNEIRARGAKVVSPGLPVVLANSHELSRVFQNLIGNAMKFRDLGRPPVVEVLAAPHEGFWRFSVRDNGIGMDTRHLHKIFLPFQRLHGKDRYPGSGMGLAICRRIVEGFGGRIWVESTLGEGSVFHFTVPRPQGPRAHTGGT